MPLIPSTSNGGKFWGRVWVPVEPAPASRPKVTRYGVTYAKSHRAYQADFKRWIESYRDMRTWPRFYGKPVAVDLEFLATPAKTTKLSSPAWDLDNAIKLILDCWTDTGLLWKDDKHIDVLTAKKRFISPHEEPGTSMWVWILERP